MAKEKQRVVAYLRCSSAEQNNEKFKADILSFANDKGLIGRVEFYEDIASGKICWRKRQIGQIVEELQKGDTLLIPEISRLGRSMVEIVELLAILRSKEVAVMALKNGWVLDDSIQSKLMMMIFALLSEIETDLLSRRVKEGLAARKASGKSLGRKPGPGRSRLDPVQPEIIALLRNGSSKAFVSRRYGINSSTLAHYLTKRGIDARPQTGRI